MAPILTFINIKPGVEAILGSKVLIRRTLVPAVVNTAASILRPGRDRQKGAGLAGPARTAACAGEARHTGWWHGLADHPPVSHSARTGRRVEIAWEDDAEDHGTDPRHGQTGNCGLRF